MEATQLAASPHRRLQESGRPVQPAGRFSLSLSLSLSARCSRVVWPGLSRGAIDQRNHMARSLCRGVWRTNRSLRPHRRLAGWPIGLNLDVLTRPVELYLEPDTVDWMRYPYWGGGLPKRGVVAVLVSSHYWRRCWDLLLRLCACFPCSEHDQKL
jgi:hypothetical protein